MYCAKKLYCEIVKLKYCHLMMNCIDLSNSESLMLHWFDTYWYKISGKPVDVLIYHSVSKYQDCNIYKILASRIWGNIRSEMIYKQNTYPLCIHIIIIKYARKSSFWFISYEEKWPRTSLFWIVHCFIWDPAMCLHPINNKQKIL